MLGALAALRWLRYAMTFCSPVLPAWGEILKEGCSPLALNQSHLSRHGIGHRLTQPNHPWTNGQVKRMNRTIKQATVKRFFYDTHEQLKAHLSDFIAA
jgi:hypothetical protein